MQRGLMGKQQCWHSQTQTETNTHRIRNQQFCTVFALWSVRTTAQFILMCVYTLFPFKCAFSHSWTTHPQSRMWYRNLNYFAELLIYLDRNIVCLKFVRLKLFTNLRFLFVYFSDMVLIQHKNRTVVRKRIVHLTAHAFWTLWLRLRSFMPHRRRSSVCISQCSRWRLALIRRPWPLEIKGQCHSDLISCGCNLSRLHWGTFLSFSKIIWKPLHHLYFTCLI